MDLTRAHEVSDIIFNSDGTATVLYINKAREVCTQNEAMQLANYLNEQKKKNQGSADGKIIIDPTDPSKR